MHDRRVLKMGSRVDGYKVLTLSRVNFSLHFLAILFHIISCVSVMAQSDWELKKDINGIRVYTKDVPGASLKAIRAETVFDAPVTNCISVLKDVAGFTTLFPDCYYSERIKNLGDTVQLQYIKLKAPWPVTDRDYAYRYVFRAMGNGAVKVMSQCLPDAYPHNGSLVRLDKGEGYLLFTPVADGRTRFEYQFHGSAGGSVPGWLANSAVTDSPLKMLENFQQMVKEDKHRGKNYGFIR